MLILLKPPLGVNKRRKEVKEEQASIQALNNFFFFFFLAGGWGWGVGVGGRVKDRYVQDTLVSISLLVFKYWLTHYMFISLVVLAFLTKQITKF